MAGGVVDGLEAIGIEVEHAEGLAVLLRGQQRLLEALLEARPVGQPGQRVMPGALRQAVAVLLQMAVMHVDLGQHRVEVLAQRMQLGDRRGRRAPVEGALAADRARQRRQPVDRLDDRALEPARHQRGHAQRRGHAQQTRAQPPEQQLDEVAALAAELHLADAPAVAVEHRGAGMVVHQRLADAGLQRGQPGGRRRAQLDQHLAVGQHHPQQAELLAPLDRLQHLPDRVEVAEHDRRLDRVAGGSCQQLQMARLHRAQHRMADQAQQQAEQQQRHRRDLPVTAPQHPRQGRSRRHGMPPSPRGWPRRSTCG